MEGRSETGREGEISAMLVGLNILICSPVLLTTTSREEITENDCRLQLQNTLCYKREEHNYDENRTPTHK